MSLGVWELGTGVLSSSSLVPPSIPFQVFRWAANKAPSSNIQAPEKFQAPNIKRRRAPFGHWYTAPTTIFEFQKSSDSPANAHFLTRPPFCLHHLSLISVSYTHLRAHETR